MKQAQSRTSFCAENMEFMRGMYDAERSGDTEMIRMRGSGALRALGASLAVAVDVWLNLLMSADSNRG
jgi:hypothetical protein